jgi:hypothetical protein
MRWRHTQKNTISTHGSSDAGLNQGDASPSESVGAEVERTWVREAAQLLYWAHLIKEYD